MMSFDYGGSGENFAKSMEYISWATRGTAEPQDIKLYNAVFPIARELKASEMKSKVRLVNLTLVFMLLTGVMHPYSQDQMKRFALEEFRKRYHTYPELCSTYAEGQMFGEYDWALQTADKRYYVMAWPTGFYLALSFTPLNWFVSPAYNVRFDDREPADPNFAEAAEPCAKLLP